MKTEQLILVEQFCLHHNIEATFVAGLHDFGLIKLTVIEERPYLSPEQLASVEKMMRLHYELEINFEGIDAIFHLLTRIETLQEELVRAQNRLLSFSDDNPE